MIISWFANGWLVNGYKFPNKDAYDWSVEHGITIINTPGHCPIGQVLCRDLLFPSKEIETEYNLRFK